MKTSAALSAMPGLVALGGDGHNEFATARPTSTTELADVVGWARRHRVPLQARSSRAPSRGSSRPLVPSAVIDMTGFDEVIRVDRRNRVVMVEAGVSFGTFVTVLRDAGLRVPMPLRPRAGKSAVTAYLEREPTTMPKFQWDLSDPLACVEVVFGTGEVFRTGSAAGPGELEQQWAAGMAQKNPMGPGHVDWARLLQAGEGSMGVVTWASLRAESVPDVETLHLVGAGSPEPLVDATYGLMRRGAVDVCFLVDRSGFAQLFGSGAGPDHMSPGKTGARARDWNLVLGVSGAEPLAGRRHDFKIRQLDAALAAPGLRRAELSGQLGRHMREVLSEPGQQDWRDARSGGSRRVFFQTRLDRAASLLRELDGAADRAGIPAESICRYVQPQLGGRLCHAEAVIGYEPGSGAEAAANVFADGVAAELIGHGAFFSRPHGAWAEPVIAAHSHGNGPLERVKSILDPDRILAPGRLALKGNPDGYSI